MSEGGEGDGRLKGRADDERERERGGPAGEESRGLKTTQAGGLNDLKGGRGRGEAERRKIKNV